MKWLARNGSKLFVAGLFLLAFLIYQANSKDARAQNWLDRSLMFVTAPLQHAFVWIIEGSASIWNDYVWLVDVAEENKELKDRVAKLEAKLVKYDEIAAQNNRLRAMVSMSETLPAYSAIGARVIAISTFPSSQVIRIDAGASDGVGVDDVVLSGAGLVGRITGVTGGYAEVQLLIDSRSSVDAIDKRTRARGMIKGQGVDDVCLVDHVVRTADIKEGDLMLTSGVGGAFPPGLLVGKIVSVSSPKVGVFRKVLMKPSTDFSTLEEVLVINKLASSSAPANVEHTGLQEQP